jgi:tetratricopeptide (TPR) repeat protein
MRDLSKAVSALLMILGASPLMAASISSTSLPSARSIGKAYYHDGEFKKAAAQFRRAIEMNPNDAESHYWMGMSYEKLADIAVPFDGRYRSKARMCLKKAMELAPDRAIYRRELFDSLLDVDGASSASFRQAAEILRAVPESDPDHRYMAERLAAEAKENSAMEARLTRVFLAVPRATYRIADVTATTVR